MQAQIPRKFDQQIGNTCKKQIDNTVKCEALDARKLDPPDKNTTMRKLDYFDQRNLHIIEVAECLDNFLGYNHRETKLET